VDVKRPIVFGSEDDLIQILETDGCGSQITTSSRERDNLTSRHSKEGSGQFRVKMHAKPQLIIFQSVRDAKILWFSCGVFDTLVGAS